MTTELKENIEMIYEFLGAISTVVTAVISVLQYRKRPTELPTIPKSQNKKLQTQKKFKDPGKRKRKK